MTGAAKGAEELGAEIYGRSATEMIRRNAEDIRGEVKNVNTDEEVNRLENLADEISEWVEGESDEDLSKKLIGGHVSAGTRNLFEKGKVAPVSEHVEQQPHISGEMIFEIDLTFQVLIDD